MASVLSKNTNYPAGVAAPGTSVTPLDSGTILGTVPPGKDGLKLTDGTQQSATTLASDATGDGQGNFTQDPSYQGQPAGYSLLGE